MSTKPQNTGEIIIYKSSDKPVDVRLEDDTVWLNLKQMADVFGRDKSVISRHIKNVYESGELSQKQTVAKFATVQKEGKKTVKREVEHYNLDMIISIGYRVNSKVGTAFRIWATKTLKDHLIKGFTINKQRLEQAGIEELTKAVGLVKRAVAGKQLTGDEAKGLLKLITDYTDTWTLLQQYDDGAIDDPKKQKKPTVMFDVDSVRRSINALKQKLVRRKEATDLFGQERKGMLEGVIGTLYQTFDKQELYGTIEDKAAHLLYFIVKDHPFVDGNKRIGAFLFILFLTKNKYLIGVSGDRKFNDSALVALTLLIAQSKPSEKEVMLQLIKNFVSS